MAGRCTTVSLLKGVVSANLRKLLSKQGCVTCESTFSRSELITFIHQNSSTHSASVWLASTSHHPHRSLFTMTKTHTFRPKNKQDKVPEEYSLIYENALSNMLGPCRVVSSAVGLMTSASAFGSVIQFFPEMPSIDVLALSAMGFASLFSVCFINWLSSRYLYRIYFSDKTQSCIGIFRGLLGDLKQVKYTFEKVKVPLSKDLNPHLHNKCNVNIDGRTFHIKGTDFILPKFYNMHTGNR